MADIQGNKLSEIYESELKAHGISADMWFREFTRDDRAMLELVAPDGAGGEEVSMGYVVQIKGPEVTAADYASAGFDTAMRYTAAVLGKYLDTEPAKVVRDETSLQTKRGTFVVDLPIWIRRVLVLLEEEEDGFLDFVVGLFLFERAADEGNHIAHSDRFTDEAWAKRKDSGVEAERDDTPGPVAPSG